jgi:hypothetical protein
VRAVARALGSFVALAALVWGLGWLLAVPSHAFRLYRHPLGETLAYRLASKLSLCRAHGARSVLFLGASSTREGFDEELLDKLLPGWGFFNAGLAAGSSYTLAESELILAKSGARPDLIVVGVHPFMLRRMDQDVVARGYVDFFDLFDAGELLRYQMRSAGLEAAREELAWHTLWPPHRHARLLGRRLRALVQRAHETAYWGPRLSEEAFQVARLDTRPMQEYRFHGVGEGLEPMIERWRHSGFLDPRAYRDPGLAQEFDAVLRALQSHARKTVLVVMPEHSWLKARGELFHEALFREQVLAPAVARGARVLDYGALLPDDTFLDLAHVGAEGRARLSRAFARDVQAVLIELIREAQP